MNFDIVPDMFFAVGAWEQTNEPCSYTLGSLIGYKKLEYLLAPALILFGGPLDIVDRQPIFKVLPRALKHFYLDYVPRGFMPDLEYLIRNKEPHLPSLRTIEYGGNIERVKSPEMVDISLQVPYTYPYGPFSEAETFLTYSLLDANVPNIIYGTSPPPRDFKTAIPDPKELWTLHSGSALHSYPSQNGLPSPRRIFFRLPVPFTIPDPTVGLAEKSQISFSDHCEGLWDGMCAVTICWDENGDFEALWAGIRLGARWFDREVRRREAEEA